MYIKYIEINLDIDINIWVSLVSIQFSVKIKLGTDDSGSPSVEKIIRRR